jgi:hypothetical protein
MGFIRNIEVWNNQIPKVCDYDICDYINNNIIGTGTTEVSCVIWEEMFGTATATKSAFMKALYDYILSTTMCVSGETCEPIYEQKIYTDFYEGTYLDYHIKFRLFWNMFTCEPLTGVQSEVILIPQFSGGSLPYNYDIDYGTGEFSMTIVEDYQQSEIDLMCTIKNIMVLIMGETFEQSEMTEFLQITYP